MWFSVFLVCGQFYQMYRRGPVIVFTMHAQLIEFDAVKKFESYTFQRLQMFILICADGLKKIIFGLLMLIPFGHAVNIFVHPVRLMVLCLQQR
jgi:hypothetical protein